MAGGVNKVILIGNLGTDPEVRRLESGTPLARLAVATSETYTDRNTGEKVETTEWHNVTLWRGLAEVAEKYLHKGDQVYIEGKLKTRSWEDENGQKKYATDIIGDNMTMLGGKRTGGGEGQPQSQPAGAAKTPPKPESTPVAGNDDQEDDLPF